MTAKPFIKICCINSLEEANMAIAAGANALGLVSEMPSGPGVISEDLILEILENVPKGIETFLLTSQATVEGMIAQYKRLPTNAIQIVNHFKINQLKALRISLPEVKIVQVIHVLGPQSIAYAKKVNPYVDFILLDSGNPNLAIKELGGTGRVHDWNTSKAIVEAVSCPVLLAGGLRPNNAQVALEKVRPFGLDICSGVRSENKLDAEKLRAFIQNSRNS